MRCPSALTATSDRLYFHVSHDGTTYAPLYTDAGALYYASGLAAAEMRWITIDRHELLAYRWVKIEIVTAQGAAVAQAAHRYFETLRLHAEGM